MIKHRGLDMEIMLLWGVLYNLGCTKLDCASVTIVPDTASTVCVVARDADTGSALKITRSGERGRATVTYPDGSQYSIAV